VVVRICFTSRFKVAHSFLVVVVAFLRTFYRLPFCSSPDQTRPLFRATSCCQTPGISWSLAITPSTYLANDCIILLGAFFAKKQMQVQSLEIRKAAPASARILHKNFLFHVFFRFWVVCFQFIRLSDVEWLIRCELSVCVVLREYIYLTSLIIWFLISLVSNLLSTSWFLILPNAFQ